MGFFPLLMASVAVILTVAQHDLTETTGPKLLEGANDPWNQKGGDIYGESAVDLSGHAVSISGDGNTVAIGAPNNDGNGNDSGHVRIYTFSGSNWVLSTEINGENAGDQSGYAVSLSDDGLTVAVGERYSDSNGEYSGQVRTYSFDGANWNKKGSDINGQVAGDQAGWSVSISGDGTILAIGAPWNDENGGYSGNVRVMHYDQETNDWQQRGATVPGENGADTFGWSVSLSNDGSCFAAGAWANGSGGLSRNGHARVFCYDAAAVNGGAWIKRGIDLDGMAANDNAGKTVALNQDGTIVAVGAPNYDSSPSLSDVGQVRVYSWSGSSWEQLGAGLDGTGIVGQYQYDYSGHSLAISNDGFTVAIGANTNDGGGAESGQVRVFTYDSVADEWNQFGADIYGDAGDYSGSSVALSSDGRTVVIGANGDSTNGSGSGQVRVYEYPLLPQPVTAAPTQAPTSAPITIETPHPYLPNMSERWTVDFPGVNCYLLSFDSKSWTRELHDFVRIQAVSYPEGVETVTTVGNRLYRKRLQSTTELSVNAAALLVQFRSNGEKQAWGFRMTISACPNETG